MDLPSSVEAQLMAMAWRARKRDDIELTMALEVVINEIQGLRPKPNPVKQPGEDGEEVAWSTINLRREMDFKLEVGATVVISKHPTHKIPEHCLGNWTLVGYKQYGVMRLRRDA